MFCYDTEGETLVNLANPLVDRRRLEGEIWNISELMNDFSLPSPETMSGGLGQFIYTGYRKSGTAFLARIKGTFGCAHYDPEAQQVFIARDWIGETPLHWLMGSNAFVCANLLQDLLDYDEYQYTYLTAAPQGVAFVFDASTCYRSSNGRVQMSWKLLRRERFHDFSAFRQLLASEDNSESVRQNLRMIRQELLESTARRLHGKSGPIAVLLSGGIDSLTVALCAREIRADCVAYTIGTDAQAKDFYRAKEVAKCLGIPFRGLIVNKQEVLGAYRNGIKSCELYHVGNTYCATGIWLLGRHLAQDGFSTALCGEGVNEALGDYRSWKLLNPITNEAVTIQSIDFEAMQYSQERELYVWGRREAFSKYNRQLGTGLAKHGVGRMIKPLLSWGVTLHAPYFDPSILARLTNLTPGAQRDFKGKPGLMATAFSDALANNQVPSRFFYDSSKIRLQDGDEGGRNSISTILHFEGGYDQVKTIEMFNEIFGANLDPQMESNRLLRIRP